MRWIEARAALAYSFLEQEHNDSEYVFQLTTFSYRQDEEEQRIDRTAWWLDSRTRGLLEVDRYRRSCRLLNHLQPSNHHLEKLTLRSRVTF